MAETGMLIAADQLLRMPESGRRYELVAGELIERALPGGEHGYVAGEVAHRLNECIEAGELGGALFGAGTGFQLAHNPDTVRAPDVAYVGPERVAQARVTGYPDLAPDLVVEVVSPGDAACEMNARVLEWLGAGSRLVWTLYPSTRSVFVNWSGGKARLVQADDTLDAEPVLPGFSCRVGELFG